MRRSQRRPQLPSHPANKNRQSNLDLLAEIERGEHVHDREGEDCDIHIYESRRNTRGEQVVLRAGIQSKTPFEEDRSYHVGFVLTRYFSSLKELISTSFEVRSPFAQQALRQVIKDYPNVDINTTGRIIIEDQPQCLFHYRKELLEYAETAKDRRVKEHVNLCLHYMETVLSRELKAFKIGVTNATTTPGLTHKDLWMVLKPGTLMYMTQDDSIRLSRLRFLEWQDLIGQAPKWILTLEVIECDGNKFGCTSRDYNIMSYDGIKSFINLTTFPLKYHPAEAQIRKEVLARGNKFISFGGVHYREYIGKAIFFGNPYPPFSSEPIEVLLYLD
jgi:hypothetical protein